MRPGHSIVRPSARLRALVGLLVLTPLAALAQGEPVPVRAVEAAPGVTLLVGQGGNVGVFSGPDGTLMVDDQFAYQSGPIREALDAQGAGPVRFLLNTHWHGDHTGGNEVFAGRGALIVAHDNVRRRMSTKQFVAAMKREIPPSPEAALPVVTFASDVSFHWNGDEVRAIHVPAAHTDGDVVVHFRRANAIHTGDVFFENGFPFIDLSSGGSIDGLIAAVDRILALADEDTAILPGHGALTDRAGLSDYRRMLGAARERVARAVAEGQGADALVAGRPLADFEERWGGGFVDAEGFLRTLHADLSSASE